MNAFRIMVPWAIITTLLLALAWTPPAVAVDGDCISRNEWKKIYRESVDPQSRYRVQQIIGTRGRQSSEWTPENRVYVFDMCGTIDGTVSFFFNATETRWVLSLKQYVPPISDWAKEG